MKNKILEDNKNDSLLTKINFMFFIYISLWTLMPAFRYYTSHSIFKYFFLFVVLSWLITSLLISRKWIYEILLTSVIGSVHLIFMLLYLFFRNGDMTISRLIPPLFLYLYAYMGYFYSVVVNNKTRKKILKIVNIIFIITALTTLLALYENIEASRLMTSQAVSPEISRYLESRNVGAYDFVYGIVILMPILLLMFRTLDKKKYIFHGLTVGLGVIVVLYANYTTAYILGAIALLLYLQIDRDKPVIKLVLLLFLFLILAPFIQDILISILKSMKTLAPGVRTQNRFEDIIQVINLNKNYSEITTRGSLSNNSFNSFMGNPLLGIGGYYMNRELIGAHAQFIDDLARFGILGALPFFIFMYKILQKNYLKLKERKLKNSYLYSCLLFLTLGFMNPTESFNISYTVFLVIPVLTTYLQEI